MADPLGIRYSGNPMFHNYWTPAASGPPQSHPHHGALPQPPPFTPGFRPPYGQFYPGPAPYRPPPPPAVHGFNPPFAPQAPLPYPILPGPAQAAPGTTVLGHTSSGGAGSVWNSSVITSVSQGDSILAATTDSIQLRKSATVPVQDVGFSNQEEDGLDGIEKAISACDWQKEKEVDVNELLSEVRALATKAEEAVEKFGKMFIVDSTKMEPMSLVTCPFDPCHRVPSEAMFKHFLSCTSNPTAQPVVDVKNLVSCLRYPSTVQPEIHEKSGSRQEDNRSVNFPSGGGDDRGNPIPANSNVSDEFDIWGGRFSYQNSAAVVRAALETAYPLPPPENAQRSTNVAEKQLEVKVEIVDAADSVAILKIFDGLSAKKEDCREALRHLLPSRYWFLVRETQRWKELPNRCSSLVLWAATGLGRIRKNVVQEWLLKHGPAHGVVIDWAMASHIYSLAKICLKSVQKESSDLIGDLLKERGNVPPPCGGDRNGDSTGQGNVLAPGEVEFAEVKNERTADLKEGLESGKLGRGVVVTYVKCPRLFRSGHLLGSQLLTLFGPVETKDFVLKLLKHCLVSSGLFLASSFLDDFAIEATEVVQHQGISSMENVGEATLVEAAETVGDQRKTRDLKAADEPLERNLGSSEVEAAMAALHERSVLESYLRTMKNSKQSSKLQMIKDHEVVVILAAEERKNRPNYMPVLEHDGLTWHRYQNQDKDGHKTRDEILAEERDYKRRRMSYRGKKLKRNPKQVLHDIIEGHMDEIVDAGGIGCLAKHPAEVQDLTESCKVESRGSGDDLPLAIRAPPSHFNSKEANGWNDRSRVKSEHRDDLSTDNSWSSKVGEDFYRSNFQSINYTHVESGGSMHRRDGSQRSSHRHDPHCDSDRPEARRHNKNDKNLDSYSRYGSCCGTDFRGEIEDMREDSHSRYRRGHDRDSKGQ